MDHGIANEILSESFYHLNSLLMLANVMMMSEDVTQAADLISEYFSLLKFISPKNLSFVFIFLYPNVLSFRFFFFILQNSHSSISERGIFYCEQSFHSLFQPFDWTHRISYLHYENRVFYLLLHRHMLNALNKR